MGRAWGIKLGSGGRCVPFCERHAIVGVGWKGVDPNVLQSATRDQLMTHVTKQCTFYSTPKQRGNATGQLWRFGRECAAGDYVLYYDPPNKHVRICRVVSGAEMR
jgi:predicted Mrr-cat superfamily restriction endonuclease